MRKEASNMGSTNTYPLAKVAIRVSKNMSIAKTNGMQTTNVNMYQTAALECCFWMLLLPASPAFATSYHQYVGFVHPNPSHPSLSSAFFASCSTYSSRSFNILFMDEMDNDRDLFLADGLEVLYLPTSWVDIDLETIPTLYLHKSKSIPDVYHITIVIHFWRFKVYLPYFAGASHDKVIIKSQHRFIDRGSGRLHHREAQSFKQWLTDVFGRQPWRHCQHMTEKSWRWSRNYHGSVITCFL